MKRPVDIWQDDPDLASDLLEERAALIEDGEKCSRWLAENTAAKNAGFINWMDAQMKINRKRKELIGKIRT